MAEKSGFSQFSSTQRKPKFTPQLLSDDDLVILLKNATILKENLSEFKERISVMDLKTLKSVFASRIAKIILDRNEMAAAIFLCGTYVADLLISLASAIPDSWYFIDYLLKNWKENQSQSLKCGGDTCFLICSLFKERGNRRSMNCRDYQRVGRGMYYQYYNQTGMEVAYHMSRQFNQMAEITFDCLQNLKK